MTKLNPANREGATLEAAPPAKSDAAGSASSDKT